MLTTRTESASSRTAIARALTALFALAIFLGSTIVLGQVNQESAALRQMVSDGNFNDAYEGFRRVLLSGTAAPAEAAADLGLAINCLQRLNRVDEIDDFRERVAAAYDDDWQVLAAVAQSYLEVEHFGYQIAGEFRRGQHRGGGEIMHATARDRVRALQLFRQAIASLPAANADAGETRTASTPGDVYRNFASALLQGRGDLDAWRLQYLTDLATLPDYEEGWGYGGGDPRGAPVDENGQPVFYGEPANWDAAQNDGQRWRWVLAELVRRDPSRTGEVLLTRADFLRRQFGVQTLAEFGIWPIRAADGPTDGSQDQSGTFALHTLGENETIARLATGIKRFELPDEHNFIKLLQQVAEAAPDAPAGSHRLEAITRLAGLFEDRRQYPRAAEYWDAAIELARGNEQRAFRERREQIIDNWGRFEPILSQPAGRGATVDYRFRNGRQVELVAHRIDVKRLLDDVKAYLREGPAQLDWQRVQIDNLGYRLVQENEERYLGNEVARWTVELVPRENSFDKRITITTPLQQSGAYLLTARMQDGNTSKIVIWLNDTAIVKKPLSGSALYYVADAVSGKPIAGASVELFGWRQVPVQGRGRGRQFRVETKELANTTDAAGKVVLSSGAGDTTTQEMQWVAIATTGAGRLAYYGFHGVWFAPLDDPGYDQIKTFAITDRPVYRPGDEVQFKFWVRHTRYDEADTSRFAHQSFQVEIYDAKNDKVHAETLTADAYGGLAGKFTLPVGAALGSYQLSLVGRGGGTFRVEEYKKPEFEVTIDAPTEPVMLGEKIQAKITAKYYFGAPVVSATVKYKVMRSEYAGEWYPPQPWDWLYGPGYWWFGYDYDWYPGWQRWGSSRPAPPWFWRAPAPPEVIAEREVAIGPDGTIQVEIDTALAKELHGDHNHSYTIQAEVTDESRRTIVGTGQVLVAREPFQVFAWVDRGFYRVGDTVSAGFAARRLDGKPVTGQGALRLLKITYDAARPDEPVETEVSRWELATGGEGLAEIQFQASQQGRYRLSYQVTDAAQHTVEGGYVFTIRGEGFDGAAFRYSDLEIVPDKRHYAPGEKVQLELNTNRPEATVLLFVRPVGGIYLPPQIVSITGKSTVVQLDVTQQDMPNFFVEALTVLDGRVHTQVREIHVPPEKRVLGVVVTPSAGEYLPGEKARVQLKITDHTGEPYQGSAVLAIYDRSVEYISGGSNVEDIKAFFWKWQRHHHPQTETNLSQWLSNLVPPGQQPMNDIGMFGGSSVDELPDDAALAAGGPPRAMMMRGALASQLPMSAAAPMAEMAAADTGGAAEGKLAAGTDVVQPTVRTDFADTALWVGTIDTGTDGVAEAELDMPENLTAWKVRVWGMGHGTRVGEGSAEVVTRKNLLVRLQAPRFFVEGDEVVLSANVHNYLPTAKQVQVRLELEGNTLEPPTAAGQQVEIPAGGEARVNWRVKVLREGEAAVRMLALTDEESDAMQMKFPVYVHGILKQDSYSGALRPEDTLGRFEINVPAERRPEQTRLEVRYSPTLAGAMVDALPYLVDYPYGCTEQTLNRFLPAVITQKTLLRMGLNLAEIREKRTNLNAQEIGDAAERARGWQRFDRNPVFDEAELTRIVREGVARLTDMQLADGGWGWFSGWGERSTPHTTAVVVHGLQIAQTNDVAIDPTVLQRGIDWLKQYQAQQLALLDNAGEGGRPLVEGKPYKTKADNIDALVYMVLVDGSQSNQEMQDYLFRDRTELAVYSLATFGLALHKENAGERLAMVMRNIGQFVVQDDENQTAYLNLPTGFWWFWYGSEYEAHAYYLKLLAVTQPDGDLAPRIVKYLINNRKHATYWNSTRDTALVVEAMADFLLASGEGRPNVDIEVWVDGRLRREVSVTPENLFSFDNQFLLTGTDLEPGRHTVELRKRGDSPLYYNGYLTNFTLEDDIQASGLELQVARKFYKLTPVEETAAVAGSRGQVIDQRIEKYERTLVPNLGSFQSGDLVEVELTIESRNDYEYIVLEDMKAAGMEPVAVQSGYTGNELGAYVELRDERVTLFVRRLARGMHSVSYRLRAEIPGRFSALPTQASAMYAPELKANSDEQKVSIGERGTSVP